MCVLCYWLLCLVLININPHDISFSMDICGFDDSVTCMRVARSSMGQVGCGLVICVCQFVCLWLLGPDGQKLLSILCHVLETFE